MSEIQSFDTRSAAIKKTMLSNEGKLPFGAQPEGSTLLSREKIKQNLLLDMKAAVNECDALREGAANDRPIDVTLEMFTKEKWGMSVENFYAALGLNARTTTISQLTNMTTVPEGYRWLLPEIIREAVRLGLTRASIYPDLIAAEEAVTQTQVTMPFVNQSDATPKKVGEAETIPVGSLTFGQKQAKLYKMGTGLHITDEVRKYVSLNLLSLYLQDAGVRLGLGQDTMAIDVLINGEDSVGDYSAPVIGVDTATNLTYKDILRTWLRMGRIGRMPTAMLSNEDIALDVFLTDEFKGWSNNMNQSHKNLNIKTPIPQSQNYFIHGAMPAANQLMLIDKTAAMLKLNAAALTVESERIASRQINGTYMSLTTGFVTMFRDARVIIDKSLAFSSNGFPTWMDINSAENISID